MKALLASLLSSQAFLERSSAPAPAAGSPGVAAPHGARASSKWTRLFPCQTLSSVCAPVAAKASLPKISPRKKPVWYPADPCRRTPPFHFPLRSAAPIG